MVRLVLPRVRRTGLVLGMLVSLLGAASADAQIPKIPKLPTRPSIRDLTAGGEAQRARAADTVSVPVSHRPPPGMCRIWLDNVPPAQQPAPTECSVAVRNRPANGKVLFGDDYVRDAEREREKGRGKSRPAERPHGPSAEDGADLPDDGAASAEDARSIASGVLAFAGPLQPQPPVDSVRRDPRQRRPVTTPRPVPRGRERLEELDEPQDEYDAGYRAGYEDALRGRGPQVRGVAVTGGAGRVGGASGAVGTTAVVVPPGQDPRYFNNGSYPPPGRANGVCLDRDQDGWCDDARYGAPVCRDLDGDGRCDDYPEDASAPYPSTLPSMAAGRDVQGGRGSREAIRWLGTAEVVARPSGGRAGGTPYRVLWYDANTNALLQAWTDRDADGIADRVEIYRNGRRVKMLGR
ncbi:MAG: hypothetical protein ACXW61_14470 [Gemmatirosa sp.]